MALESAILMQLGRWPDVVADTALAELALDIARRLDRGVADTPAAQNYAQLREALRELREMAAAVEVPEADALDDLQAKRERRRGA